MPRSAKVEKSNLGTDTAITVLDAYNQLEAVIGWAQGFGPIRNLSATAIKALRPYAKAYLDMFIYCWGPRPKPGQHQLIEYAFAVTGKARSGRPADRCRKYVDAATLKEWGLLEPDWTVHTASDHTTSEFMARYGGCECDAGTRRGMATLQHILAGLGPWLYDIVDLYCALVPSPV